MPRTAGHAAEQARRSEPKAGIAQRFDLVADVYGQSGDGFFNSLGQQLAAAAGLRPGDRVLDLGCGRGAVLFAAAATIGPDGYAAGIDLSPRMVRATIADAARRGLRNVAVRVGDAEDPGYPTRSFEAVLAGLMMFITPDPDAVLTAVRRLLVPGGRFAMTTFGPAEPGWAAALDAALAFQQPAPPTQPGDGGAVKGGNGRFDTLAGIAEALDRAGFTDVRTVEVEQVATVADPEQWWASVWSSGRRAALERIPQRQREQARQAAFRAVEALRVDGVLTRRTPVRLTTAVSHHPGDPAPH
jgi:ubiquinone/menaquinone biosynthesis C-methylase UbiE